MTGMATIEGTMDSKADRPNWESAQTTLEMRGVHAAYHGDISILNGLSMAIKEHQITGIIGPNGAGKSTALKTMYGFLKPSQGSIVLNGQDISASPPYDMMARGVAFVPQNRSLFNELTVEDNLRLGCWIFRKDRRKVETALESVYSRFPILKEKRRDLAGSLSGGQQRFVELGRALVVDPKIIMLDEPTAMIAPRISREIYHFIETLPEQGITVVLVDQNVRQCTKVSDYIYILDLGRNRGEGTTKRFSHDDHLKEMVAEWLDYQID
jgi:branched-chain amino acid transport system ATP-binding protein